VPDLADQLFEHPGRCSPGAALKVAKDAVEAWAAWLLNSGGLWLLSP
jgi:hypothetical protein